MCGTRTWLTSQTGSVTTGRAGDWPARSGGGAPSDGSRTNSMRSLRISCRPGTPFVTPAPSVVPWSGLLTTTLSTRRRPSNTFPRIRNRPCRNLRLVPYRVGVTEARTTAEQVVPPTELWVAEDDGVALVGLLVLDQDRFEQLYVEPTLTGRGIGSELIGLAKRARPQGLRLWTFESNLGAQRFYERHGFRQVAGTAGDNEEGAPDILYVWEAS